MNKYREYMKNRNFTRSVFFIVFTAVLLYITYFVLRDFSEVTTGIFGVIGNIVSAFSPLWIGLVLAYIINPMVNSIDRNIFGRIHGAVKLSSLNCTNGCSNGSGYTENPDGPASQDDECSKACIIRNKLCSFFNKSRGTDSVDGESSADESGVDGSGSKTKTHIFSILVTYLLIIAAIIAIVYGFAAMILGEIIITSVPDLFKSAMNLALSYEAEFKTWAANLPSGVFSEYISEGVNTIFAWLSDNFSASGVISKVSGLSSSVLNFVLGVIVSIYLIADRDFFMGMWKKFVYLIFPHKNRLVNETLSEINEVLSSFVRGVLIDSVCVAILSSIGLSLIGLKFAVFIGVFAGIANVIPYFGPVLGMVPAFLIGTFTDSLITGLLSIITLLIVQQIDSNLIYPRVVGSSTGLKPLFVLLAVSAAGYYGGIMGMLLAVPTAGILQIFILKFVAIREAQIERKDKAREAEKAQLEAQRASAHSQETVTGSFRPTGAPSGDISFEGTDLEETIARVVTDVLNRNLNQK